MDIKLSDIPDFIDRNGENEIHYTIINAVREYLRIDDYSYGDGSDPNFLSIPTIIIASKMFIKTACGITDDEELDKYPDLALAFLVLCAEMYDNRTYTVSNDKVNPLVKSILDLHNHNIVR